MRILLGLATLVCAGLARGEDAPRAVGTGEVGLGDPVVTLQGFCPDASASGESCTTVITRAQFEKLTTALEPGMPASLRLVVANALARNLRMAAAAEKRGLDKTPQFEQQMRYARWQLLARDLDDVLRSEAGAITPTDLKTCYDENPDQYEQATLARIFVPHAARSAPEPLPATEAQTAGDEGTMAEFAAELRARAVAGEDPDTLQREAELRAGLPPTDSSTRMEDVRRAKLPPRHETVMDLPVGGVSQVISDPAGAHFIYKMISKRKLGFDEVESEIRTSLVAHRYRDSTNAFSGNVIFSDAYFNPPTSRSNAVPQQKPRRKRTDAAPMAGSPETHKQAARAEGVVEGLAPASQARPRR
jgi:hypothetical protein